MTHVLQCVFCAREARSYFRVARTNNLGEERGKPIFVCSIVCLIRWAYAYGVRRGVEGVRMVRDAVGRLVGGGKR